MSISHSCFYSRNTVSFKVTIWLLLFISSENDVFFRHVRRWPKTRALTICMQNPVIPGRIQMKRFICIICLVNQCLASSWGGRWQWRSFPRRIMVFYKWYISNPFPFWETFSSPVLFVRIFYRNILAICRCSRLNRSSGVQVPWGFCFRFQCYL